MQIMQDKTGIAGNAGPKVRSDLEVKIVLKDSGGIVTDLTSRVSAMYGKAIEAQCHDMMKYFGIPDAHIAINDSGALPFVISARIEAALRMTGISIPEFLPEMIDRNLYSTEKGRFRLSRLYLPGNTPGLMLNAGLHSSDAIILDLEDSVAPEKKDEARLLVRNALRQVDFFGAERMVRINQGRRGIEDLAYVIPHNVNLVVIPKCESPDDVAEVENEIQAIMKQHGLLKPVYIMPVIESALGVERSFEIASSGKNVVAMAIGLEDFTADIGVTRTDEGMESLYARTRIVNAAKAAGIQAIDSVFSDVANMEGLERNIKISKSLGFVGMGCIHPRQVPVVRRGYSPDQDEIDRSMKIVEAYEEAGRKGLGVVSLGTKMIDPPVVRRAQATIDLAVKLGKLSQDWRDLQGIK